MPYKTIDSPNLPPYVKNKPEWVKQKWISIFNAVLETDGEEAAFVAANSWLKRELEKLDSFMKRSVLTFDVDTTDGFIKRSEDDEDYVTLVLNTDWVLIVVLLQLNKNNEKVIKSIFFNMLSPLIL
jgi:hypothetical protein